MGPSLDKYVMKSVTKHAQNVMKMLNHTSSLTGWTLRTLQRKAEKDSIPCNCRP